MPRRAALLPPACEMHTSTPRAQRSAGEIPGGCPQNSSGWKFTCSWRENRCAREDYPGFNCREIYFSEFLARISILYNQRHIPLRADTETPTSTMSLLLGGTNSPFKPTYRRFISCLPDSQTQQMETKLAFSKAAPPKKRGNVVCRNRALLQAQKNSI